MKGEDKMNKALYKIVVIVALILAVSSCVPIRKQVYVQNPENSYKKQRPQEYNIEFPEESTILVGDELYISVRSADEGTTMYSSGSVGSANTPYLQSNTVNNDGEIQLPYIKTVKVVGLTLNEAELLIESRLGDYLFLPSVKIKKINSKVKVMGEVGSPGVYFFESNRIDIFEALGYAGDITTYGNRKRVLIIKEDQGVISKNYIDLTDQAAIISELIWIESDDIIYVEPLPSKKWAFNDNALNVLMTLLNTAVLLYTLVLTSTANN